MAVKIIVLKVAKQDVEEDAMTTAHYHVLSHAKELAEDVKKDVKTHVKVHVDTVTDKKSNAKRT